MMGDIAALVADLEALKRDFDRLFSVECDCVVRTDRRYWPSRFAEPRRHYPMGDPVGRWAAMLSGTGLEVEPRDVRTAEESATARVYYDVSGCPVVNSNGESLILDPGWQDCHEVYLSGPGAGRAEETIKRANELVSNYAAAVMSLFAIGRRVVVTGFCWPSVVNLVADSAGRSVLKTPEWFVRAGGQSYSLDVWRRRASFELGGPMVEPEIVDSIGEEPEGVYSDRRAFLRDSELAIEWLICRLAKPIDEAGVQVNDPATAALKAVVEAGFGAVLNVAARAPAIVKASKLMRDRLANGDRSLYEWTQQEWADKLGMSKKTINNCEAWREIMDWRASNQAERVSKETRK